MNKICFFPGDFAARNELKHSDRPRDMNPLHLGGMIAPPTQSMNGKRIMSVDTFTRSGIRAPDRGSLARDIVTPLTIVTFVVSTVTGVMLLAHWNAGLVRFSHEWLSVAFSAIALWHLARNWKSFTAYLRRGAAVRAFVAGTVLSVVITAMTGSGGGAPVNPGAVFRALSSSSLESAAPAFGMTADRAIAVLGEASITATGTETLAVIGERLGMGAAGVVTFLATHRGGGSAPAH